MNSQNGLRITGFLNSCGNKWLSFSLAFNIAIEQKAVKPPVFNGYEIVAHCFNLRFPNYSELSTFLHVYWLFRFPFCKVPVIFFTYFPFWLLYIDL